MEAETILPSDIFLDIINLLNDIAPIISAITAVVIAIFAWRTWKISNIQHKMCHDPDLRVYSWPELSAGERLTSSESTEGAESIGYSVVLAS